MSTESYINVKSDTLSNRADKVLVDLIKENQLVQILTSEWFDLSMKIRDKLDSYHYPYPYMENYKGYDHQSFLESLKTLASTAEDGIVTLSSRDLDQLVNIEKIYSNHKNSHSLYLKDDIDRLKRQLLYLENREKEKEKEKEKETPSKEPEKPEEKYDISGGMCVFIIFAMIFAVAVLIQLFS